MRSVMQTETACYICGTTYQLERHHCIHGTANRRLAEQYGLTVYLCKHHHELVHRDIEMDRKLQGQAQKAWEERYGNRSDFMAVFGRSYL